jgi:dihydroorotase-like cyclic amidohydrolase
MSTRTFPHSDASGKAIYESATRAACAGGIHITTCIAMPLNSVPATTRLLQVLSANESRATSRSCMPMWDCEAVSCRETSNDQDLLLTDLLQAGCWGWKAFLSPLPASAGSESVTPEQLLQAAKVCGQYDKPLLVHAALMSEKDCADALEAAFDNARKSDSNNTEQSYQAHLKCNAMQCNGDILQSLYRNRVSFPTCQSPGSLYVADMRMTGFGSL